jgi:hypothetical protein
MLIAGVFLCISARHAVQDSSRHERPAKEDRLQRSCAHASFDPEFAPPTPNVHAIALQLQDSADIELRT